KRRRPGERVGRVDCHRARAGLGQTGQPGDRPGAAEYVGAAGVANRDGTRRDPRRGNVDREVAVVGVGELDVVAVIEVVVAPRPPAAAEAGAAVPILVDGG